MRHCSLYVGDDCAASSQEQASAHMARDHSRVSTSPIMSNETSLGSSDHAVGVETARVSLPSANIHISSYLLTY